MRDNLMKMERTGAYGTAEEARLLNETKQVGAESVAYDVPLKVAFTGFKRVPWLCISHNSLSPRLVLCDEDFLYRVIVKKRRRYDEIESVDMTRALFGRHHFTLTFRNSIFSFVAQAYDESDLCRVMTYMQLHGVELREGALNFILDSCASIV